MSEANEDTKECPYCPNQIPVNAKRCPYCQSKLHWTGRLTLPLAGIGILAVIAVFMVMVGGSMSNPSLNTQVSPQPQPTNSPSAKTVPNRQPETTPALEMMEAVFQGNYTQNEIKALLDQTMRLYALPITEENYERVGSVLVSLRKEMGTQEMEVLNCMREADYKNTLGQKITAQEAITQAAALCATLLQE